MKLIGLIGGMSWQSSAEYYRLINQAVAARQGGQHSARLLLYSVDFDPIARAQHEGRWDDTGALLADAARALRRGGAELLVLCTNTMHKVADVVEREAALPLIHIADTTAAAVKRRGLHRVGLLGTRFTMEDEFYRGRLRDHFGLDVLVPGEPAIGAVHRIIFDELCHGRVEPASRHRLLEIIADLVGDGAEGVILGCTEIPLLVGDEDVTVPVFDTTRLHAEAAVEAAFGVE